MVAFAYKYKNACSWTPPTYNSILPDHPLDIPLANDIISPSMNPSTGVPATLLKFLRNELAFYTPAYKSIDALFRLSPRNLQYISILLNGDKFTDCENINPIYLPLTLGIEVLRFRFMPPS